MRIDDDTVWLSAMPKQHCASCAMQPGCGQTWRLPARWGRQGSAWLRLPRHWVQHLPDLAVGDSVWVAVPQGALLKGSLQLYGWPVLSVLLGSALANALGWSDWAVAGVVLFGLSCSLAVLHYVRKRSRTDAGFQVLSRIEGPEARLPVKGL